MDGWTDRRPHAAAFDRNPSRASVVGWDSPTLAYHSWIRGFLNPTGLNIIIQSTLLRLKHLI